MISNYLQTFDFWGIDFSTAKFYGQRVTGRKTVKTWKKTRLQNLVRHKSGRYYARAFADGKEFWKSLKTSSFSVAEARLADFMKEHRERRPAGESLESNKATFAEALAIHLQKKADDISLKPTTLHYWKQVFASLLKSWPGLAEKEIRKITVTECREWARQLAKSASPTRYNNTIAGLSHVFEAAIDAGIIYQNPAGRLERVRVRQKSLSLPSRKQFQKLVASIASAGAWCSKDCADYVEGLAYTGMRKGEAAQLVWADIDFQAGEVIVRGDPETGTKNWEIRRVPMIGDARTLFCRMQEKQAAKEPAEKVFKVREAQKAIDSACKKLKIPRFTHHDLRHLFATTCIESGVDIPTVSRWLGHKDGGALAMKTYGHLRREHSIAQAQKVCFGITQERSKGERR
ncbi:MAG: site-specific integrase [Verrucomicrobiota bacterium]